MINWNITTPEKLISGIGGINFLPSLLVEMELGKPFLVVDPEVEKTDFGKKVVSLVEGFNPRQFRTHFKNNDIIFILTLAKIKKQKQTYGFNQRSVGAGISPPAYSGKTGWPGSSKTERSNNLKRDFMDFKNWRSLERYARQIWEF